MNWSVQNNLNNATEGLFLNNHKYKSHFISALKHYNNGSSKSISSGTAIESESDELSVSPLNSRSSRLISFSSWSGIIWDSSIHSSLFHIRLSISLNRIEIKFKSKVHKAITQNTILNFNSTMNRITANRNGNWQTHWTHTVAHLGTKSKKSHQLMFIIEQ